MNKNPEIPIHISEVSEIAKRLNFLPDFGLKQNKII